MVNEKLLTNPLDFWSLSIGRPGFTGTRSGRSFQAHFLTFKHAFYNFHPQRDFPNIFTLYIYIPLSHPSTHPTPTKEMYVRCRRNKKKSIIRGTVCRRFLNINRPKEKRTIKKTTTCLEFSFFYIYIYIVRYKRVENQLKIFQFSFNKKKTRKKYENIACNLIWLCK